MTDIPRSNSFSNKGEKRTNLFHSNIHYRRIMKDREDYLMIDAVLVDCQQMLEKLMKYLLNMKGVKIDNTHNLTMLNNMLKDYGMNLNNKEYGALLIQIKDFFYNNRYSNDDYVEIEKEEYEYIIDISLKMRSELLKWVK